MLWLEGLDFDAGCARLEMEGYRRIAEGDWAYVYQSLDSERVIRMTPYDPAYLLFVQTCWLTPHRNLPSHQVVVRLAWPGYAVEMPRYSEGDLAVRETFVASLQSSMSAESTVSEELAPLCLALNRGIEAGKILIPYFKGIDWNPANVMMDGATPKLVDAFYQEGVKIYEALSENLPVQISSTEVESFWKLPCFRRPPEK